MYASKVIITAMKQDTALLYSVRSFATVVRALHLAWDPFHTGHMTCDVRRVQLPDKHGRPIADKTFLSCKLRYVSGITNTDVSIRWLKIRYVYKQYNTSVHCGETTTWGFETYLANAAYNKLCGDPILDTPAKRGLTINILPATGTCAVIVNGKVRCLE